MPLDVPALLQRHVPVLKFDSLEPYYADSAAEWTDNPGNVLRRADGTVLATATPGDGLPQLSLSFLGPSTYADGTAVQDGDRIADPAHDYVRQAAAMHAEPGYANQCYGHGATGSDGRLWLAYWFFYFYNDYNLVGSLLPAGLHEGDWEMIQLRLDPASEAPDLAVYAQHTHAGARSWDKVERVGDQPVVYPARGSHASYFDAGLHWTGHWFDHADGRRPSPPLEVVVIADDDPRFDWATWPGMWGGTVPDAGLGDVLGFDDSSPRGPGGHAQWRDPVKLLDTVEDLPVSAAPAQARQAIPAAPGISVGRAGAGLRITYSTTDPSVRALIVSVYSEDDAEPPATFHVTVSSAQGAVEIPANLASATAYDVNVVVATANGVSSDAAEAELPAAH